MQKEKKTFPCPMSFIASLLQSFDELKESTKNLENENAKLVSHTNLNQKIQHHLNLKKENNNLKEVSSILFHLFLELQIDFFQSSF